MSLLGPLADERRRRAVATAAVAEAEAVVRRRTGLGAVHAQVGLATINRLRPGFFEHHVHAMLPDLARSIDAIWQRGGAEGVSAVSRDQAAATTASG